MAADLPLYTAEANAAGRRPRNKRFLLGLALSALFFLLFLNFRLDSSPDHSELSISDPKLTSTPPKDSIPQESKPETNVKSPNNIVKEEPVNPAPEIGVPGTVTSPHSNHHNALPHPFDEDANDNIVINNSSHYPYLVIIASEAQHMSRRALIREKYFGMRDNLLPCMHFNANVLYKFWIHGGVPKPDTPLRRAYEAEKMEWNDLVELPRSTAFEQVTVLEWAETALADQGITYDYLIVQDIHTFMQLATIKQELDSGVISEKTESPFTLSADAPTNFVWGTFSGQPKDKHAFVIGATAVKLALEKRAEIQAFGTPSGHLLTNMYQYYRANAAKLEKDVDKSFSPEEAAEVQEHVIPEFIREDRAEDTHRFIRWENNVESVHAEDIVITHLYQDSEFRDVASWTHLSSTPVCYRPKSAFADGQPALDPLDDDEDTADSADSEDGDAVALPQPHLDIDGPSIAVVTSSFIYDRCMEPSATLAAKNKRDYALKHGYSFVARSSEFALERERGERKTVWGKIDVIEKVLPKYDWVFWMDMDAVIMNQDRSLAEIFDNVRNRYEDGKEAFDRDVDFIIARPGRDPMINAGVFLMRNTPWSMQFLRRVQGVTEWFNKGPSYEQGAMWQMMQEPDIKARTFLLDRDDHTFNTFPRVYQPGDFVVHFAPDKCPNDATLKGLAAAQKILDGETVTSLDEE
ncbi:galactosyl transferase GMA12/MNN10 family-domain-containing protein [Radiomyces spectabilis]|uniref:galactosyl transferase GMA12/MNN10 family-domain-containing protein n=1 Tax=Radiomyces spectabilis TaxID=64574 RepID=UPI00221EAB6F|nr:galactosyl transferase GMA12/MNN10 family-domain-containing protein [Radiomyces spectabilis]KAI8372828.1 galactosyl transferase GMA12/MNN10 family-domain-containing protein [Radiomyces spectabilis]